MWFLLALAAGFCNALSAAFSKKALQNVDAYIVPFAMALFALPFLAAAVVLNGWKTPVFLFWPSILASGLINVAATIIMMRALKSGDFSLTIPYFAFTPLFLVVTSYFMLGETVKLVGFIGIVLIVFGAYVLNWNKSGLFEPFRSFAKNTPSQLALLTAFLYSISTNFDKIGIKNSDFFIYPTALYVFQLLFFLPVAAARAAKNFSPVRNNLPVLFLVGFISAASLFLYSAALSSGTAAYTIALQRTLVLWSVLIGYFAFKEKGVAARFAGAGLMLAGVLLIYFG